MTEAITDAQLDEVARLIEYAEDAPWVADIREDGRAWIGTPAEPRAWGMHGMPSNTRLIVALRNAAPALVAAARERGRLFRWKVEATEIFEGLQDLGRALGLPLGTLVTGPAAVAAADALQVRLCAIEALAAEWEGWAETRSSPRIDAFRDAAQSIRAALADDDDAADDDADTDSEAGQ
ncbi:hypothetical protein GCM10023340_38740 [Nocardioides marinquilinus]|uniref:DUF222 domain-containing protein n=1 Tax=Nocardioides marinquilinus TaxID=1210400 RepID=A0ABP9Q3J1_9ACTN